MSPTFSDMIYAPRELALWLADGLVARGHDVTFATAPDIETKAKLLPGDQTFLNLISPGISPEHSLIKRDYELDLIARAFKEAQSVRYDVIHVYAVAMAHYFQALCGSPVVYTLHDPMPEPGTLGYALFQKFIHHHYVSISDSQRKSRLALNFEGTVYHGIDTENYSFHPRGDNRYVFMGRLVPEKGLGDAMKACVLTNSRLAVASHFPASGEESDYFKTSLAPFLDDPNIEKVGMMTVKKKIDLLGNAKALLFPIAWEEPFGMVMIEAMACGTPVIAYNRGSVPEIVKDGVTGFIVEPKMGIAGLVEAMGRINEIDRSACRKHIEAHFSVDTMSQGYEKIYSNL